MWWTTDADPDFAASPAAAAIDRAYRALEGYETYMLGSIAANLEIAKTNGRLALPEGSPSVHAEGPEGVRLLMTASREKGIQFHFHAKETDPAYCDRFWRAFAGAAERMRAGVDEAGAPRDPPTDEPPTRWWSFALRMDREGKAKATMFGIVILQ
ncbi:MAG TPA: hypothetical protein VHH36_06285 [Candidatus Thermoplasmatota archaeon]|nr:hypothetical protein [Candidatus Thermoplasmatota archaeon]